MPIANGDIGLNMWAETNGDVAFYVGKTDAWGENVPVDQGLMNVGGLRVSLSPAPLTAGASFLQELKLHEGEVQITEGDGPIQVSFRIWADANT